MTFKPISQINVSLHLKDFNLHVGRLAIREQKIYFQYDSSFVEKGLEISPIRLPLKTGVQSFDRSVFEGLPGVFYDSLPDGWGRMLLDRKMRSLGVLPQQLSSLDRLAYVGQNGMGALVYEPDHSNDIPDDRIKIEAIASQVIEVLSGEGRDLLPQLLTLSGSSTGARPKTIIGFHKNRKDVIHGMHQMDDGYQPWLVKFPNTGDGADAGAIEYVYSLMAVDAGLMMPDVHLFPSQTGGGYFAIQRFDKEQNNRMHMHSACGLLHSDYRVPSLDYEDLLALTMILTRDIREVEKMFRLAVFNVFAHNRDDHGKNFSYLMDKDGEWRLSPAYDLTFSSGPRGEQSTTVMGEGKTPSQSELMELGLVAKLPKKMIHNTIEQTRVALGRWPELAEEYGVKKSNIDLITSKIIA
ncbi:MAG: type II toxin-antitoxin system HipA family toxin [Gammaproteobacteria bacterium]|nr:type II toxin-antitoxin system HipA family toxin [Gammaproteobacteria bacterium]MCY4274142.1 type II toxin-antitoxin system HipA family toxin [Gammaproteobacteria bacterium]